MPSFISHAAYLKKFWNENKYPSEYFYDGFLGSILPDIRYLTKENREKTHLLEEMDDISNYSQLMEKIFKKSNLAIKSNQISSEDLFYFRIGFSFHVVLDKWWPKQIYYPSKFEKFGVCLKLLDDILLKKEIKETEKKYLNLSYNLSFLNLSEDIVKKWYDFIFWYIKKQPAPQNIKEILVQGRLFKEEMAEEITNEVNRIFNNQEVKKILQDMYKSFSWKLISKNQVST